MSTKDNQTYIVNLEGALESAEQVAYYLRMALETANKDLDVKTMVASLSYSMEAAKRYAKLADAETADAINEFYTIIAEVL